MIQFHLAQLNIANAKASMDSPVMAGFVARLDEIHELSDKSKGFVWRWESESIDSSVVEVFGDPKLLVNLSLWESVHDLKHFVYKTVHVELIQGRAEWFDDMPEMHQVLWWVPVGHIPSVAEAKEKLELLRAEGPTAKAFSMAHSFPLPPHIRSKKNSPSSN
jgi:hypothetical protein